MSALTAPRSALARFPVPPAVHRATAAALLLVVLGACSSSAGLPKRTTLPSCGQYGVSDSDAQKRAVVACFYGAASDHRQAEIVIEGSSVEGKKIRNIDRVLGPNSFEVYTKDDSWTRESCSLIVTTDPLQPRFADCSQT